MASAAVRDAFSMAQSRGEIERVPTVTSSRQGHGWPWDPWDRWSEGIGTLAYLAYLPCPTTHREVQNVWECMGILMFGLRMASLMARERMKGSIEAGSVQFLLA